MATQRTRTLSPKIVVAGVLVAITGFATACGEDSGAPAPTSPITSAATTTTPITPSVDPTSSTDAIPPVVPEIWHPPFVDHVEWVNLAQGRSLQIYPTLAGRRTAEEAGDAIAWREVLAAAPDADTPGMRAQFDCHWTFARAVDPDKPSWNIEPWRPVVTDDQMIATRCNPGGPEE